MQPSASGTRGVRWLIAAAVLTVVALGGFLVADLLSTDGDEGDRIALDSIPDHVSMQRVGDRAVVFVRDGGDVTAFAALLPAAQGQLVWCENRDAFATALSASHYSLDGDKLDGPGPDDLLRLPTSIDGDDLVVGSHYPVDWPRGQWSSAAERQFLDFTGDVCFFGL